MTTHPAELLKGLDDGAAAALRALGTPIPLTAGEALFRLGDEADRLFLVESGRIALSLPLTVRDRAENVLVEERLPGQALGWSGLIPPHRFTLTAVAEVDSLVLGLRRTRLLQYFAEHPEVGYVVTQNVAAVVGQRLHVVQAMWLREVQRVVALRCA